MAINVPLAEAERQLRLTSHFQKKSPVIFFYIASTSTKPAL